MAMELRNLHALVAVVQNGSFSAAARVLYTSQPNVSKAVKQLEDELGVPLLDRGGTSISLTDVGEIVYRHARRMLATGEELLAELDDLRGLRRGRLRLGLPMFGSSELFSTVFVIFRHRYPGVRIQLVEQGSKRLEEMLRGGEIDLAASLAPVPEDFDYQEVLDEPLVVLMRSDHPLAGQSRVRVPELADRPMILFEEGFLLNRVVRDCCARYGFRPQIAARSGQPDFIMSLVQAGLGITLLPRFMAEKRPHPDVTYLPLDEPDSSWHMVLLWRKDGYLPHAAKAWLELAREARIERLSEPSDQSTGGMH